MVQRTRRHLLRLGGALGVSALAGCGAAPFASPRMTLTLLNFDDDPHPLVVSLRPPDGDAPVFRERFELAAPAENRAAAERRRPDLVASRPYRVRAALPDAGIERAYRYEPNPECAAGGGTDELVVEVRRDADDPAPGIGFLRNGTVRCD